MLKVRVIPTLLWKGVGLVKGVGFDSWRRIGPVLPALNVYTKREVDELILVDILASVSAQSLDIESIVEFSEKCFVPLTVGGGVSSIADVSSLLRAGADKVAINSSLYSRPQLVKEVADSFGSQCVVVSIDARAFSGRWRCYSRAGSVDTGRDLVDFAKEVESLGAGEILLTSIERDGTMQGYDLDMIEAVTSAVKIPVIASGGAGKYDHMIDAVSKAGASAVAAASMFHFTEQTPAGARSALAAYGIPVRLPL